MTHVIPPRNRAAELIAGQAFGPRSANVSTQADSVSYAQIQNVSATSRVLGRKTAGAGDIEECTLSEVLDFVGSAAQGDILYRDASGWARLPAGTSGHFLKTRGRGANPAWAAASGSGGALTYIGAATVAGAAATSLTISGLDLDTDLNYLIKIKGKNATASGGEIYPYINADTTATNYDSQVGVMSGSGGFSTGRANNARMADLIASSYFMGTAILTKDLQNKPTLIYTGMDGITTALRLLLSTVAWRTAGTNLTGITFTSSVANSLDIGTRVDIWRFS